MNLYQLKIDNPQVVVWVKSDKTVFTYSHESRRVIKHYATSKGFHAMIKLGHYKPVTDMNSRVVKAAIAAFALFTK